MDTVYDKSYIEHDQINSDSAKTPQFSTNSNEFDVSLSQCKNDFLCLNDKSQEMFLRKLVNTDVAVFQDHNSIIDGLFDKYCLGLGSEEKKMLAEALMQACAKNSDTKESAGVHVAKRNVIRHAKVPGKVTQNVNVAKQEIEHVSGKSTLANLVKLTLVISAVAGVIAGVKKLYNGLVVGSLDGKKVDGVKMGWLAVAYRNIVDSAMNLNLVESAKNKAAAALMVADHCNEKIGGDNVCDIAKGIDSKSKLDNFVEGLEKINKAADKRSAFEKIFKSAPTPLFNVSEKKEIVKKIARQSESVKDSSLYQFGLNLAAHHGINLYKPSKWERLAKKITGSITLISQIVKPISPLLNFIPGIGKGLAIGVNALNFSSGYVSQFIQQKQANEVK